MKTALVIVIRALKGMLGEVAAKTAHSSQFAQDFRPITAWGRTSSGPLSYHAQVVSPQKRNLFEHAGGNPRFRDDETRDRRR